jgi:hypothetical protein
MLGRFGASLAIAFLSVSFFVQANAQHHHDGLQAADYDALTRVLPGPIVSKNATAGAVFEVTYEDFSAEAQAAFEHAVSLWAAHISSSVPIRIRARWRTLETNTLGSAGPTIITTVNGAEADTWYPPALAAAITGQQVSGIDYDIVATFNSVRTDWYFGLDGLTPIGQYDFVSVVMHEIGHGLGMFDSFRIEGEDFSGEGSCAEASDGEACWGYSTNGPPRQTFPIIYDRFVIDDGGSLLINTNVYPIPSIALADALTGGMVFFDSETVLQVHHEPALLFAPANYLPASSIAHLDETHYPPGDPNSLMTPRLARAEAIHTPGPIFCAILNDMGWPLGDACVFLIENPDLAIGNDNGNNGDGGDGSGDDGNGDNGDDGNGDDNGDDDGNGDENGDDGDDGGDDNGTPTGAELPSGDLSLTADGPYPNPTLAMASIVLESGTSERVTVTIVDMMGREASFLEVRLTADAASTVHLPTDALAPGVYVIRISGQNRTLNRTLVVVR